MNRVRPARWLAARRAAKRRGTKPAATETPEPSREPLPPLVSPDDDREFLQPERRPVPVAHEAAALVAAMDASGVVAT